ncbi:hypothetical protein BN8_02976 [Fibrisoma limi BUZ 3]|uniref:Uncharacterized protein n=1 Tax=Fibrisoma limi BUZ 3 TaxID=1185876 RepID=I2GIX1_9BACT|nr:hypothetical protein BN8_02976 [Fibrisoma limi BUZ 3]
MTTTNVEHLLQPGSGYAFFGTGQQQNLQRKSPFTT